jgi:hypothetical protein
MVDKGSVGSAQRMASGLGIFDYDGTHWSHLPCESSHSSSTKLATLGPVRPILGGPVIIVGDAVKGG